MVPSEEGRPSSGYCTIPVAGPSGAADRGGVISPNTKTKHLWPQRTVAALLGLTAALFIAEVGLRALGHRRPPPGHNFEAQFLDMYDRAFRRTTHEGAAVYESVRSRLHPSRFAVRKPSGRRRIFIIGDSTAWSFPGGVLEEKLRAVLPGAGFEVINAGMPGSDAYRVLLMGKEVLGYDPDLVVVIVGNNEFFGLRRLNPWKHRGPLSRSAVFRLLCDLVSPAVTVRGKVEADRYFSGSLSRLAAAAAARQVPLLFCTEPANFLDNHFDDAGMSFAPDFVALLEALRRREFVPASRHLAAMAGRYPDSAFLEHYRGRLAEARGDHAAARRHYALALELDPNPIVCTKGRNDVIRGLAVRYGLLLADIERRFLDAAPHGIPGFDLFRDNCHPWPPAYGLYADALIEAAHRSDCSRKEPVLAPCRDWRMERLPHTTYASLSAQISRQKQQTGAADALAFALTMVLGQGTSVNLPFNHRAVQYFDQLFEISPQTLRTLDDRRVECEAALSGRQWVAGLAADLRRDSSWGRVLAYAGEVLRRAGQPRDALRLFDQAVACSAQDAMARHFRGWARLSLGRRREAAADFAAARRLDSSLGEGIPGLGVR